MVTFMFKCMRLPVHPCPNHNDVHVRVRAITGASMPKPQLRSCSKSIRSPVHPFPKHVGFRAPRAPTDPSIHAQTIMTGRMPEVPIEYPAYPAHTWRARSILGVPGSYPVYGPVHRGVVPQISAVVLSCHKNSKMTQNARKQHRKNDMLVYSGILPKTPKTLSTRRLSNRLVNLTEFRFPSFLVRNILHVPFPKATFPMIS